MQRCPRRPPTYARSPAPGRCKQDRRGTDDSSPPCAARPPNLHDRRDPRALTQFALRIDPLQSLSEEVNNALRFLRPKLGERSSLIWTRSSTTGSSCRSSPERRAVQRATTPTPSRWLRHLTQSRQVPRSRGHRLERPQRSYRGGQNARPPTGGPAPAASISRMTRAQASCHDADTPSATSGKFDCPARKPRLTSRADSWACLTWCSRRAAAAGSNRTKRSLNHTGATSLAGLLSATASNGLEADLALAALGGVKGRDMRWPAGPTASTSSP